MSYVVRLPMHPYGDFRAMAQDATSDYTVDAFVVHGRHEDLLCLATKEGPVYITREQARLFFNFKE